MRDKIEEFVQEHRDEFDIDVPPARLWKHINGEMTGRKVPVYNWSAAAIIILFIVGALYMLQLPSPAVNTQVLQVAGADTAALYEAERYYTAIVHEQRYELNNYCRDFPGLLQDFSRDMDTLTSCYANLKTELAVAANKNVIKQAMVENLQTQAQMVSRQLSILREICDSKNNKI